MKTILHWRSPDLHIFNTDPSIKVFKSDSVLGLDLDLFFVLRRIQQPGHIVLDNLWVEEPVHWLVKILHCKPPGINK